jgi:quercetin dioxygenase-like cupin family protein
MRLHRFDAAAGRLVAAHGSHFVEVPLTDPEGRARAACLHLEPGGLVGRHEAAAHQLLCVVSGSGWVAGEDGARVRIAAGRAAAFARGEPHEAGTDIGMTAIVLEGDGFSVWAPAVDPPAGRLPSGSRGSGGWRPGTAGRAGRRPR